MSQQYHNQVFKGLAILIACQWLGNILAQRLALLPGTLYGLLLLLGALVSGLIPIGEVEGAANLLLDNLAALFVPAAAGVMLLGSLLREQFLPIVGTIVLGTLLVMAITGLVVNYLGGEKKNG